MSTDHESKFAGENPQKHRLAIFAMQRSLGWRFGKDDFEKLRFAPAPIRFTFGCTEYFERMEALGIPLRTSHPFAAPWYGILSGQRNISPHLIPWVEQLLFVEWSLMNWRLYAGFSKVHFSGEIKLQMLDSANEKLDFGTKEQDLVIKWFLDYLAVRLRAAWDKITYCLIEIYGIKLKTKDARTIERRLPMLQRALSAMLYDDVHAKLLAGVTENGSSSVNHLKKFRDGDLHFSSVATSEVFGAAFHHDSIAETWKNFGNHFSSCREALMAALALAMKV